MLGNDFFRKGLFFTILLFLVIFLTACPRPPMDVDYFKGTRGMEMEFLENAPPEEIYEESNFGVNIFIENRGAFDVYGENSALLSISYDPFYLATEGLQSDDYTVVTDNYVLIKGIWMPGKSRFNPVGAETVLSIPNFKTTKIQGQRERPSTQIFASLCYPYVTQLAHLVCVDRNVYGQNLRRQPCVQQDLSLSDQGAPVAITLIEVENQPVGVETIRPVFTITMKNKGSGSVLSPVYGTGELERVCSFENLNKEDFNTVMVRAMLSNNNELDCQPNPVKLFEGDGITRCSVRDADLAVGRDNYEAPLMVNLSYVYLTSISAEIEIKRTNVYGGTTDPPSDCLPSQVRLGERCVNKCDYCNLNPGDGSCQPSGGSEIPHIKFEQGGFACQCSSCADSRYKEGLCVPFSGFCVGAMFCCQMKCKTGETLINGECYPKCSTTDCAKTSRECGCGTKDEGYSLIEPETYCCPDMSQSFGDRQSCVETCLPPP